METSSRTRWLLGAAVAGVAVAGLARVRSQSTRDGATIAGGASRETTGADAITERHATPFLVRRAIDPERVDELRDHVVETLSGADPDALLGLDGASTATLFLDGEEPQLVWYVEVPRAVLAGLDEPAARVADAVPIDHDAIDDDTSRETVAGVTTDDATGHDATTHDATRVERSALVHAASDTRPRSCWARDEVTDGQRAREGVTGGQPTERRSTTADDAAGPALVTAPFDDACVEVELVRMELAAGLPERLADLFERLTRYVESEDRELTRIESWSAEMLEAERMYTESVFLERAPDGYALEGYMETADVAGVYDAYYDTSNPVARASEWVLGWALVDPSVILSYPLETGVESLAHAVDPDRARTPAECAAVGRRRSN